MYVFIYQNIALRTNLANSLGTLYPSRLNHESISASQRLKDKSVWLLLVQP